MVTWGRFVDLISFSTGFWHRWYLQRVCREANNALGERMYAVGIDDGRSAAQISILNEKLRQAKASGYSVKAVIAERQKIILQLAAAALEVEAPLPGADAEYQKAREAMLALQALGESATAKETAATGMVEPVAIRRRFVHNVPTLVGGGEGATD